VAQGLDILNAVVKPHEVAQREAYIAVVATIETTGE
jgi:hypothetical protein